MADPLDGARAKLHRANLHTGIAAREATRFFQTHPNPTFRIEPEGDTTGLGVGGRFRCAVVVETGYPDPPISFSTRLGDSIHNYRCALDHVAWQLASHGTKPPRSLSDGEQRRIQFPIYEDETTFDDQIGRRLPGVAASVVSFIKQRHQFVAGRASNNALTTLANLSNDDKHRTLHAVTGIFETLANRITFTRCRHITYENPPARPAVKNGAVVALMECEILDLNPQVVMQLAPSIQIALEDGRDFVAVLQQIRGEVAHILNAPEIAAAL